MVFKLYKIFAQYLILTTHKKSGKESNHVVLLFQCCNWLILYGQKELKHSSLFKIINLYYSVEMHMFALKWFCFRTHIYVPSSDDTTHCLTYKRHNYNYAKLVTLLGQGRDRVAFLLFAFVFPSLFTTLHTKYQLPISELWSTKHSTRQPANNKTGNIH